MEDIHLETLTWKEFLAEVATLGSAKMTEDRLYELVSRLEIDCSLMAPYVAFSDDGYSRNVLHRDDNFEAICICWQPGQGTPVHNHGRSFGVISVYEGKLGCTNFRRNDDGSEPGKADLSPIATVMAAPGSVMLDRIGSIHRLGNPPSARRRAVSLHFYAGPLDVMELFDPLNGTVVAKPMAGEPMLYIELGADVMAAMI